MTHIIRLVLYGTNPGSQPGDWRFYPEHQGFGGPWCRTHSTRTARRLAEKKRR